MELPKNLKYVGATVILEATGEEFHTVTDWNLWITSPVNIGDPVQQTKYITVPGANTMLDVSEALTGRPTFEKRPVETELSGIHDEMSWDAVISNFRNSIEGRVVHIIFDNDPNYYWRGRAHISEFDRAKKLGKFKLSIPEADPYKYNVKSNIEPWLWDPFDFENDTIPEDPVIVVNEMTQIVVPRGNMYTCPSFTVTDMSGSLTMTVNGRIYDMVSGYNYFPAVMINGDTDTTLTFRGYGNVIMEYRGGSL